MKDTSKLIGMGSSGCVFKPSLPCHNQSYDPSNDQVSKLVFSNNVSQEIKMNHLIQKIDDSEKWSQTWNKSCKAPTLTTLQQISMIEDCLDNKEYKNVSKLLIGDYAGIPYSDRFKKIFTKQSFNTPSTLQKAFMRFIPTMKSLFIAIQQLHENKLCHHDLNYRNITSKNQNTYLLDFGLSFKFNDIHLSKKRITRELKLHRIYLSYPYEYLFAIDHHSLEKEKDLFYEKEYKENHPLYLFIHEKIFQRKKMNHKISSLFEKSFSESNLKSMIQKLDTYSLGMLFPILLVKIADEYHIPRSDLLSLLKSKEMIHFLNLFKQMTTFDFRKRISPDQALEEFSSLLEHLTKTTKKKKKTKKTHKKTHKKKNHKKTHKKTHKKKHRQKGGAREQDFGVAKDLLPYVASARKLALSAVIFSDTLAKPIIGFADILGDRNPVTDARNAFPPKWIASVLLSQCWNSYQPPLLLAEKAHEYQKHLLKSGQGYRYAYKPMKVQIDRCYYPISTGDQTADLAIVKTHYIYNDFEKIFDKITKYAASLKEDETDSESPSVQGGGGIDTIGQMGDHGQTIHRGMRAFQNPGAAIVRHARSSPKVQPVPMFGMDFQGITTFVKGAGGKAVMSNVQTQIIIMLIQSLVTLMMVIYFLKKEFDYLMERMAAEVATEVARMVVISKVFDETDRYGPIYPKETLLMNAFISEAYDPFDYVICQRVAECVTCHMIARNKPSFKKKYTLDIFRRISKTDKDDRLGDFLISFLYTLKLCFSSEDTSTVQKSTDKCREAFERLLSGKDSRKGWRHLISEGTGTIGLYKMLQTVAGMIIENMVKYFPFMENNGEYSRILTTFITDMLATAVAYPLQVNKLVNNTKMKVPHNSLRSIFKDLYDVVNTKVDKLEEFVESSTF